VSIASPARKISPYIEVTSFPIIMRGPSIARGASRGAMVQNIDLRPTFEDTANAQMPSCVDGVSFLRTPTTGAPFLRRYALSESLGGACSWRAVYDADEVIADRYQLESSPTIRTRRSCTGCSCA
jgi:arylsulfatase A-like enzyme